MTQARPIEVKIVAKDIFDWCEYTDWYDFADFLKQEELAGQPVVVIAWRYKDKEPQS